MKNFCVFLVSALFLLPTVQAVETDYRQGLSIWFDTPNSLTGQAVWLRSNGNRGANLDREWESRSLPIGNGSLGANILGSVAAERITLNEKTLWRGGPNTSGGADYYWNVNKQSAPILKEIRQREEVFSNEKKRKTLNALAHPEIRRQIEEITGDAVIEVPLLFESGMTDLFDRVIVVTAGEDARINRIVSTRNISKDLAKNIIKNQATDDERIKRADYVAINDGTRKDLYEQAKNIIKRIFE